MEDGNPIRGCLIGMVVGGLIWAVIIFLLLLILNRLKVI